MPAGGQIVISIALASNPAKTVGRQSSLTYIIVTEVGGCRQVAGISAYARGSNVIRPACSCRSEAVYK